MIEKPYSFTTGDEKVIERLVDEDVAMINHVILPKGERLPEHYSDSNVFLTVIRGTLSMQLGEQKPHCYSNCVVQVPFHTKMNIINGGDEVVEFFIVKAPHPRIYKEQRR
jgi:quercetin dioxygenase-like cupin family protein